MSNVEQLQRAAAAHRRAVESTPADMVRFLQDALGQKLVAYIANVSTPRTVARWVNEDRTMGSNAADRIAAAFQIFRLIVVAESDHVVRGWFAGLNPLLDDESPATVIREGRYREAMAAARAFVSNA